MIFLLASTFFGAALLYASVGFGGGSAYLALMGLFDTPLQHMAFLALICNVIVVAGGGWQFSRAGHFRAALLFPFLITSLPAAYLGGRYKLESHSLELLTGGSLFLAAIAMLANVRPRDGRPVEDVSKPLLWGAGFFLGGILGGAAGLVGIGGGIFLAPILYAVGWGTAKQIAATASLFILFNSISGLAGQWDKVVDASFVIPYAALFAAVLLGGQIGSRLGAKKFSPLVIKRLTGALVLVAAVKILVRAI